MNIQHLLTPVRVVLQPISENYLSIVKKRSLKKSPRKQSIIIDSNSEEENINPKGGLLKDRKKKGKKYKKNEFTSLNDVQEIKRKGKKRRLEESGQIPAEVHSEISHGKVSKVKCTTVPVLKKLSIEEDRKTSTYQRFNAALNQLFDSLDDIDLNISKEDDAISGKFLIPMEQLQHLCTEAAELKMLGSMQAIPPIPLVKLLNILKMNIQNGMQIFSTAQMEEDDEYRKLWLQWVIQAADASTLAIHILTSPNMPKKVYLEDVIEQTVLFTKFHVTNTIYPAFDPSFHVDKKGGVTFTAKKKGRRSLVLGERSMKNDIVAGLYMKLTELVNLLADLFQIRTFADTIILPASMMAVTPFSVEHVTELQLSCLKLATSIFSKYEKHRMHLLEDILASIEQLLNAKKSLRTYKLTNSEQQIHMLSALVLQLVQCVTIFPEGSMTTLKCQDKKIDPDALILKNYETGLAVAGNFLSAFLNKCGDTEGDVDYWPLFEIFVQDLLTTVNKPEWPAAEILLKLLGKLLIENFMNKGSKMTLRIKSLENFGVVTARLRKDYVTYQEKIASIDHTIADIKAAENKGRLFEDVNNKTESSDPEGERIQFLQQVLLDYMAIKGRNDPNWFYTRHFYISLWYRDCMTNKERKVLSTKPEKKRRKKRKSIGEASDCDEDETPLSARYIGSQPMKARKQFLVSKIKLIENDFSRSNILQTCIDYESLSLVSRYLASKRPLSLRCDSYLKQILKIMTEPSVPIRTKAIRCLAMVVEGDPSVLGLHSVQLVVRSSFFDQAISVREAAVDLVGKFVSNRFDLMEKYYEILSDRILDTGVSVRKKVIKIFGDMCIESPNFPKIPEICVKVIRRITDDEMGVRKLVLNIFENMWFTPFDERSLDHNVLWRRVSNIMQVVAALWKNMNLELLETLLMSLFKSKDDAAANALDADLSQSVFAACVQIVDCIIKKSKEQLKQKVAASSQSLSTCLTTLYLFAKVRPQLLVHHAIILQSFLNIKCQTQNDYQIVTNVAKILKLIVPLMKNPSETFLAHLEKDLITLTLQHDPVVVTSCLSCLESVVNNITKNYTSIRNCFKQYYGYLCQLRENIKHDNFRPEVDKPYCKRALFVVGLLMKYFNFSDKEIYGDLSDNLKHDVFDTFMFYAHNHLMDIKSYTIKAIGFFCIRHPEFMLGNNLKQLYYHLLSNSNTPPPVRAQVLQNLEMYLVEEEQRVIKRDETWSKLHKKVNLKEMDDMPSNLTNTVIQLYIKDVLDAFLHEDVAVRSAAFNVTNLVLQQGLVYPIQTIPHLICMSTDREKIVSHSADKHLQQIETKYPGFVCTKAQIGIRLSYRFQKILQGSDAVRGFRSVDDQPAALNGFLYLIIRNKKEQRRAVMLSLLRQFDEQKMSLAEMLYLADNLAYFPYQVTDEPLFIIHHINLMISTQSFQEATSNIQPIWINPDTGCAEMIYDENDNEAVANREDVFAVPPSCLLLVALKQHLKNLYGLTDVKINKYSPSVEAKVSEKAVRQKLLENFNPEKTLKVLRAKDPPPNLYELEKEDLVVDLEAQIIE